MAQILPNIQLVVGLTHSTFKLEIRTPLPPSCRFSDILHILHDHDTMIRLNPLVVDLRLLPQEEAHDGRKAYEVTNKQNFGTVKHKVLFWDERRGVRMLAHASMGFISDATWVVENGAAGEHEELVLVQVATITCSLFLRPFVRRSITRSQDDLAIRIVDLLSGPS
ncbi:hypothetical protein BT69DRAFT_610324 [Atractiella rhizophila]|nr:hypothetical protein BT69DRAFT_610324 [Atractiella rhizophila]